MRKQAQGIWGGIGSAKGAINPFDKLPSGDVAASLMLNPVLAAAAAQAQHNLDTLGSIKNVANPDTAALSGENKPELYLNSEPYPLIEDNPLTPGVDRSSLAVLRENVPPGELKGDALSAQAVINALKPPSEGGVEVGTADKILNWIKDNWKGLAIGGGTGLTALLAYALYNRYRDNAKKKEKE